jgi:hypothetical protein
MKTAYGILATIRWREENYADEDEDSRWCKIQRLCAFILWQFLEADESKSVFSSFPQVPRMFTISYY